MFSWIGSIFSKITSAAASILVAVGSIATPSTPTPPPPIVAEVTTGTKQPTSDIAPADSVISEIEQLRKEIEYLKKAKTISKTVAQTPTQPQSQAIPKKEPKTFTLPSGAVADENGNILNQAELSQKQLLEALERQRVLLEVERREADKKARAVLSDAEMERKVKPAITKIECEGGSGSGFIIDQDGYILTAHHVIHGCAEADITLSDGRKFMGAIVGYDEHIDAAILKINASNLSAAELGDSSENILPLGARISVFGHPRGLSGVVRTKGDLLSRQGGSVTFLHTDAQTQGGSSGGAWVDSAGKVIGVHTAGDGPQLQGFKINVGFNYAIAINSIKPQLLSMKSGATRISVTPLPPPSPPQPDMPQGSTRTIPQSIVGSIMLNPDLTCNQLGVSDKDTCWQYKLYKDRYNWNILGGQ